MAKRSAIIALGLFWFSAVWLFGGAKQDVSEREPATGLQNWEHSFDISAKKPGVYNIFVESQDTAGNASATNPINVYVDPDSDLPITTIANPLNGMRVGGDFNIVGTCVDDDAVAAVKLQIDDGDWLDVEGTEFWTYFMKSSEIADGRRKITAYGIDIYGLAGPEVSIVFDMDRRKPVASVTSHSSGQLVSGKTELKGTIYDANGVVSAEYSLDGGVSFENAPGSFDQKSFLRSFSAPIDTSKLPDGPTAILIRATDGVGSVGITPFMLVIDNTKPVLELIYPGVDDTVDGKFQLFGLASDSVGLKSLSWKFGELNGEIDVSNKIGDPYWTIPINLKPKSKDLELLMTATDKVNNRTDLRVRIKFDLEKDRPKTSLLEPTPGSQTDGQILLAGYARDDDGVAAVEYWWDNNIKELQRLETSGAFLADIPVPAPGKRQLNVRAIDIYEVIGPTSSVNLEDRGPKPTLALTEIVYGPAGKDQTSETFFPGLEIAPDARAAIKVVAEGGSRFTEIRWSLAELTGQIKASGAGSQTVLIPVPAAGPYGNLDLRVEALDVHGRSAEVSSFIYVTNYAKVRGEPSFVFFDERLDDERTMRFGALPARPLEGRFIGATLAQVRLEPSTNKFRVSSQGQLVTVNVIDQAVSGPHRLVAVTDRGHEFRSEPLMFIADLIGPELELDDVIGGLVGRGMTLAGRAYDPTGLTSGAYSIRDSEDQLVLSGQLSFSGPEGRFEVNLDISNLVDGLYRAAAQVFDAAGNSSTAYMDILKDTEAPEVVFVCPRADSACPIIAGLVTDVGGVARIEYAEDGENFRPVDGLESFCFPVSLAKATKPRLRVSDLLGNTKSLPIPGFMDSASGQAFDTGYSRSDDPKAVAELELIFPEADSLVGLNSLLIFRLNSPRGIIGVNWSFGSQKAELSPTLLLPLDPYSSIDFGGSFIAAIPVKDFQTKSGSLSASVSIKDIANKTTNKSVRFSFDSQLSLPSCIIKTPKDGEILDSSLEASLFATSPAGIAAFKVSLDSEAPDYINAIGSYLWHRSGISAGNHSLTVIAVDKLGRESTPVKRNFKTVGEPPKLSLQSLNRKEASESFISGEAYVLAASSLEGLVTAGNPISSLEVQIAGRPAIKANLKKLSASEYTFTVPLPADLPHELITVEIQAKDAVGKSAELKTFFYKVAAEAKAYDQEGLYSIDSRIQPQAADDRSDYVLLSDESSLRLRFNGRPIESVLVEPVTEVLTINVQDTIVNIVPKEEGITLPTTITVLTVDGDPFVWPKAVYAVDWADPTVIMDDSLDDGWFSDYLPLAVELSDANGIDNGQYSFDGLNWRKITFDSIEADHYSGVIKLDMPDGGVLGRFRFQDLAGRDTTVFKAFNKDSQAPRGQIMIPRLFDSVNGRVTVSCQFQDNGTLATVEFSDNGGKSWEAAESGPVISRLVDFSKLFSSDGQAGAVDQVRFRATDKAGNISEIQPGFKVDTEIDKPITVIQLPEDNEVLRSDFTISGAVFDDDAVALLRYQIDDGDWIDYPIDGNSFNIPIALADTSDNEHQVTAYAVDIYGVVGDPVTCHYRISKAEPVAIFETPPLDQTVSGIIDINGSASDANGIDYLEISFDNAVTFHKAINAEDWTYRLDTTILKDGLHSIYVKPFDKYGTEGFYASLISVDNTPPEVMLDLPLDGAYVDKYLFISGRVADNRVLEKVDVVVFPRGDESLESYFDLGLDPIIQTVLDLSSFPDGEYGIKIIASDKAGNQAISSRDFFLKADWLEEAVFIVAPVRGEQVNHLFRVQGRVQAAINPSSVSIFLDNKDIAPALVDKDGWFSVDLDTQTISEGPHKLTAGFFTAEGKSVISEEVPVEFSRYGAWIRSDSFSPGAFVPIRPWLNGTAGWVVDEDAEAKRLTEAQAALVAANTTSDKKVAEAAKKAIATAKKALETAKKGREVVKVEISLDNGRTFLPAKGTAQWRFRLETQDYPEGPLPLILRAQFRNGQMAASRLNLNLDKTAPSITILSPKEGDRFNDHIRVFGIASDDSELAEVRLSLREGDKAGYELPAFIQGLYLDSGVFGGTLANVGIGLTFFDDNVKLQAMYGYLPDKDFNGIDNRFFGSVVGAKLLANILTLPFSYWFGPDWEFLEAGAALGTNVSYFLQTQSGDPLLVGAVIAQLEFPKFNFAKVRNFRTLSVYSEFQLWMVTAEIDGGVKSRMSFGLRTNVF